jgi:hypothetical protein
MDWTTLLAVLPSHGTIWHFHKIWPRRRNQINFHIRINLRLELQDQSLEIQGFGRYLWGHTARGSWHRDKDKERDFFNFKIKSSVRLAPCAVSRNQDLISPMPACPQ